MLSVQVLTGIGFLLLGLEHFGVSIPGWLTGVVLVILAVLLLFGIGS